MIVYDGGRPWLLSHFLLVVLLSCCIEGVKGVAPVKSRPTLTQRQLTTSQQDLTTTLSATLVPEGFVNKVNPPLACPFTNQGAFVVGSQTKCSAFTNADGITAIQLSTFGIDPTSYFLPFMPCATQPVQTYYLPGTASLDCTFAVIAGQSTLTFSTPAIALECILATTFPSLCVYPQRVTINLPIIVVIPTEQTGFVDVPTFTTTTQLLSATFTISSTRTSSITDTTIVTNTVTVESLTSTTIPTTLTITFSEDVYDDQTESTSTTTYIVTTSVSLSTSTTALSTTINRTRTIIETTCLGPFGQPLNKIKPTPYVFRQERVEQVQCPIPYAGSVYNSNIGSSISTICNVAGATQLLTSESVYNTWLWSMIKTYTPCAYADLDSVFWIGSSAGNCYALESTTTTIRPCAEIHPVICVDLTTTPADINQIFLNPQVVKTVFITTSTQIVTRLSTFTITANRSVISSVIITVPTFTTTTKTSTRRNEVTMASTVSVTNTAYTLTTTTLTVSDTVDTTTITLSSVVLTRTVTSETTLTSISTKVTTVTTVTEVINSCPVTITRTVTLSSTYRTVITNVIPIYSTTIYTTDSQCYIPDTTTWATSGCGCANAVSGL